MRSTARVGVRIAGRRRPEYLVQNDKVHGSRGLRLLHRGHEEERRRQGEGERLAEGNDAKKKRRTSPSNSRRRTKKLSKEKKLRIEPNEALIENMCKGGCIFLEDTR